MSDVTTKVIRHIYTDSGRAFIEVGPGPDGFGVEISTSGASAEYFGLIGLVIDANVARHLGAALIAAAGEV